MSALNDSRNGEARSHHHPNWPEGTWLALAAPLITLAAFIAFLMLAPEPGAATPVQSFFKHAMMAGWTMFLTCQVSITLLRDCGRISIDTWKRCTGHTKFRKF